METRNNKILGASLSLVAFSFGFASQAYAQTCKVHPTCEGLGYVDTESKCENGEMVKCPFDASKVFCRKKKKTGKVIKFVAIMSKNCPTGLSFSGYTTTNMGQKKEFLCSSSFCYDNGNPTYQSNESETIIFEGESITLNNLNSVFISVSSPTGKSFPISNNKVTFNANTSAEMTSAGLSLYDIWTLQCGDEGPTIDATANITVKTTVTGMSNTDFYVNGTTEKAECKIVDVKGKTAPVGMNQSVTGTFSAGHLSISCPFAIKPTTGYYNTFSFNYASVNGKTINNQYIDYTLEPNGNYTINIYYREM